MSEFIYRLRECVFGCRRPESPHVQPEFQWVSSRKLLKLWLFVLAGPADWRVRDVERLLSTRHSTRRYLVFQVAQRGVVDTKKPGVVRERSVVLEINGTDVQPSHFGVEGRPFHSQSIGSTRCAPDDSTAVFQSLKDELALGLLGHLAGR